MNEINSTSVGPEGPAIAQGEKAVMPVSSTQFCAASRVAEPAGDCQVLPLPAERGLACFAGLGVFARMD